MKLVIQRVTEASVEIEKEIVGRVGKGFLVLFGACGDDTTETVDKVLKNDGTSHL